VDARHADYFERESIHRRFHHHQLTFSLVYAFNENFILPLSHDEVVHGKGSLLSKMPGDRGSSSRTCARSTLHVGAPGKKLLFMGGELATPWEWNHDASCRWSCSSTRARRRPRRSSAT
jgi:1,4-alpha-glucan branching enzyme